MKIVISPDSFKESLSSKQVCTVVKKGLSVALSNVDFELIPIADGGEGMMQTLCDVLPNEYTSEILSIEVRHPFVEKEMMTTTTAKFAFIPHKKLIIVESAEAVGLDLIPIEKRNPLFASTFGLGEMLIHINEQYIKTKKADTILFGIGGTSTVDVGIGMLQALGVKFFDKDNKDMGTSTILGGGNLLSIERIDTSSLIHLDCSIIVASDVQNPLYGTEGAAKVFGPQKGADAEMVEILEKGVKHFAGIIAKHFDIDEATRVNIACAGAAGGLGASLSIFLKAEIQSGIDTVMDYVGLEEKLQGADLLITGEGKLDGQSLQGKVVFGVANLAKKYGVPVCVIAGALGEGYEVFHEHGVIAMFSATPISLDWEHLKNDAEKNLYELAKSIGNIINLSMNMAQSMKQNMAQSKAQSKARSTPL